jgi:citronellol/citronellal dehydrogenase
MQRLKGKTILITGASRGIGHAIALRYAAAGANIVAASKDSPENLREAADQITASGGQVLALDCDVCDYHAIKQAVAQAVDRFGGIDVLVNNTSATCFTDTLHTLPEHFDLAVATSVRAAFFMFCAYLVNVQGNFSLMKTCFENRAWLIFLAMQLI